MMHEICTAPTVAAEKVDNGAGRFFFRRPIAAGPGFSNWGWERQKSCPNAFPRLSLSYSNSDESLAIPPATLTRLRFIYLVFRQIWGALLMKIP